MSGAYLKALIKINYFNRHFNKDKGKKAVK